MVAAGEVGKARLRGGIIIFKDGPCFWAPRSGGEVFSQSYFLSYLTAEKTQDHSILTEDKNLCVCRLFFFRLRLITISVGM
jgi:hypothetical protein